MSILPRRWLFISTIVFSLFMPLVSVAQVTIKEKVEIKPKTQVRTQRLEGVCDFFYPTQFIDFYGTPMLTLPSDVVIGGSVGEFMGPIGGNQEAVVTYVISDYQDFQLAWRGRNSIPSGGEMYSGGVAYHGVFDKGAAPNVQLYTLDVGGWSTGAREWYIARGALEYRFSCELHEGTLPTVPVVGSATVNASILPLAQFSDWAIWASPQAIYCGGSSKISFMPLDSNGSEYLPAGWELMGGSFKLDLECQGDYAYLTCGQDSGKHLTVTPPWQNECHLHLDTRRGSIPHGADVATVTISKDGKWKAVQVSLQCPEEFDHFVLTPEPDTVLYTDYSWITGVAVDKNGVEVPLNYESLITMSALPGDFGRFYQSQVYYDALRSGYVLFAADQMEPTTVQNVAITASLGQKRGATTVAVKPKPCLVVRILKNRLGPGESTPVILWQSQGGVETRYDSLQMFFVEMNVDEKYGKLRSGEGDEGPWLHGHEPFTFIAANNIEGDTTIQITVTESNGGVSTAAREGPKNLLRVAQKTSALKLKTLLTKSDTRSTNAPFVSKGIVKNATQSLIGKGKGVGFFKKVGGRPINRLTTCSPTAELELEQKTPYPACTDETSLNGIKNEIYFVNRDGGGWTYPPEHIIVEDKEGKPSRLNFIAPEICSSGSNDCLSLMIPTVQLKIVETICKPSPSSAILVNSKNDVTSYDSALVVVDDLANQIVRIGEIIAKYKKATGKLPPGEAQIDMSRVRSTNGIVKHEDAHAGLEKLHIEAARKTKALIGPCIPSSQLKGLGREEILRELKADDLTRRFEEFLDVEDNTSLPKDEVIAHMAHRDYLRQLLYQVQEKHPIYAIPPK